MKSFWSTQSLKFVLFWLYKLKCNNANYSIFFLSFFPQNILKLAFKTIHFLFNKLFIIKYLWDALGVWTVCLFQLMLLSASCCADNVPFRQHSRGLTSTVFCPKSWLFYLNPSLRIHGNCPSRLACPSISQSKQNLKIFTSISWKKKTFN